MTIREKDEYLAFAQKQFKIAFGFAPARKDVTLLEAYKNGDGFIDYVLCKVGLLYYRMNFGSQLEFVDENGHNLGFVPSRFGRRN